MDCSESISAGEFSNTREPFPPYSDFLQHTYLYDTFQTVFYITGSCIVWKIVMACRGIWAVAEVRGFDVI